jgi:wyosine [tRNA(Phe)-imidazoG37] synthetase (radical SAM superfamily)
MTGSIIYGPVPSWRLGRSLGIDLLSHKAKTCNFNCVYCQLSETANPVTQRGEFTSLAQLTEELKEVRGIAADYVTFSGTGEPTLASNLGQAIKIAKSTLNLPVAVLTNASLMPREDVRHDLAKADVVVAAVDAHTQDLFRQINRPVTTLLLTDILEGIKLFRREFGGKLCLEVMFMKLNKNFAGEIAQIAELLSPDQVQLNTPLRPCAVKPLTPSQMSFIKGEFVKLGDVITVYEASRPEVTPLNLKETLRRRPKV